VKPPLREISIGANPRNDLFPADESAFLESLGGPTLLRLEGRDSSRVRVLSTLLHGNEPSGLRAVIRYLRSGELPATDVIFFIGSVHTALTEPRFSYRTLPGEIDANRCWTNHGDTPQGKVASRALTRIVDASPECLVDLHNNTGHNPAYGVAFRVGPAEQSLVSLFADRIVHTPIELGTLVEATVPFFPSVTVECGRAGDSAADEAAWAGLQRYLAPTEHDLTQPLRRLIHLEEPVRVCVRRGVELAFGDIEDSDAPFTVSADIDRHNFERLPAGSPIGWVHDDTGWPIEAVGHDGTECSRELFEVTSGVLRTRCDFIPIMMTTSQVIAKSDCLFYAVQPAPSLPDKEGERAD
jgi:hypothetical protein